MGLKSFLQRKEDAPARSSKAPAGSGDPADAVQQARVRARRRLIGAVVLLGIGIIGFPLLFETQPRPIPVNIPIDIPHKENAPPLKMPPARPGATVAPKAAQVPIAASRAAPVVITETASEAGKELPSPSSASAPERAPAARNGGSEGAPSQSKASPARSAEAKPEPPKVDGNRHTESKAAETRPSPAKAGDTKAGDTKAGDVKVGETKAGDTKVSASASDDANRAKSLLEGKGTDKTAADVVPAGVRFVVQVGAFSEASAARETREKVEKLGLKAYTQVVDTDNGKRIRVRVGPFASKDDADKAASKIRSAGLSSAVLTL
ncbi:MAG TPA: SPOR domain-containing protein [Burkholderiaceae bacterium]|nr:SPOR domain-containing protein [Burkholderiaceae bacterium]